MYRLFKFFIFLISFLIVIGCNNESDMNITEDVNSVISIHDINSISMNIDTMESDILASFDQINDSILSIEVNVDECSVPAVPYSFFSKLGLAFLGAVDAKGFYLGLQGNKKGKIGTSLLSGLLYGAGYSVVAYLHVWIGSIFNGESEINRFACAAANTLNKERKIPLLTSTKEALSVYNIRYHSEYLDLLKYSYAHNDIVEQIFNDSVDMGVNKLKVFSISDIQMMESNSFKKEFDSIPYRIKDLTIPTNNPKYNFENKIFEKYLRAINSIDSNYPDVIIMKTEALCYEYSNKIQLLNNISEDHKQELIISLYVAPLSVNMWLTLLKDYE